MHLSDKNLPLIPVGSVAQQVEWQTNILKVQVQIPLESTFFSWFWQCKIIMKKKIWFMFISEDDSTWEYLYIVLIINITNYLLLFTVTVINSPLFCKQHPQPTDCLNCGQHLHSTQNPIMAINGTVMPTTRSTVESLFGIPSPLGFLTVVLFFSDFKSEQDWQIVLLLFIQKPSSQTPVQVVVSSSWVHFPVTFSWGKQVVLRHGWHCVRSSFGE